MLTRSLSLLFAVMLMAGCGSDRALDEVQRSPLTSSPALLAVFAVAPQSQVSGFVAFYSNQRYFSGVVQKVGSNFYRASGSVGYYEEKDGVIEPSRRKTTCPQVKGKKKIWGSTKGDRLVITVGTMTSVLSRVELSQVAWPAKGMVIEWGCFDRRGAFTAHEWSEE